MTLEDIFIKDLSGYLDIEISEFDATKIKTLLGVYKAGLPLPEPTIIFKDKIVYKDAVEQPDDFITATPLQIIKIVSELTGVELKDILGNKRERQRVEARHVTIYLIKKYCPSLTLKTIGGYFNRDHTTVIHSINNVNDKLDIHDYGYKNLVDLATLKILSKTA